MYLENEVIDCKEEVKLYCNLHVLFAMTLFFIFIICSLLINSLIKKFSNFFSITKKENSKFGSTSSIETHLNITTRSSDKTKKINQTIFDEFQRQQTPTIVVEDFEEQFTPSTEYFSDMNSDIERETNQVYNYGFGQTNPHFLRVPTKNSNRTNISIYDINDCFGTLKIIQKFQL